MTYVLDTSSVLSDPDSLDQLSSYHIVLPMTTLYELESKRHHGEIGYPARKALRYIESLRENGSIKEGVLTSEGGSLRVAFNNMDKDILADDQILEVAKSIPGSTLLSEDLPLRLKAEMAGVQSKRLKDVTTEGETIGTPVVFETDYSLINDFYDQGEVYIHELENYPVHTSVILRAGKQSALGRITKDGKIRELQKTTSKVRPRNAGQEFAMDVLSDSDIGIVSIGGSAGSGKTLLALAASLEAVSSRQTPYNNIIVFRPVEAVGGQELGFLPGTQEEKMTPWAAAINDALGSFMTDNEIRSIKHGGLQVLPLTHIRGRSFKNTILIVDEAQNLDLMTLVTVLSRLGEGSKIILTHDLSQRDNVRVGKYDGIHKVIEKLSGDPLFCHITLTKTERSDVAELVARSFDL